MGTLNNSLAEPDKTQYRDCCMALLLRQAVFSGMAPLHTIATVGVFIVVLGLAIAACRYLAYYQRKKRQDP